MYEPVPLEPAGYRWRTTWQLRLGDLMLAVFFGVIAFASLFGLVFALRAALDGLNTTGGELTAAWHFTLVLATSFVAVRAAQIAGDRAIHALRPKPAIYDDRVPTGAVVR